MPYMLGLSSEKLLENAGGIRTEMTRARRAGVSNTLAGGGRKKARPYTTLICALSPWFSTCVCGAAASVRSWWPPAAGERGTVVISPRPAKNREHLSGLLGFVSAPGMVHVGGGIGRRV
jgi:hypothetical protein